MAKCGAGRFAGPPGARDSARDGGPSGGWPSPGGPPSGHSWRSERRFRPGGDLGVRGTPVIERGNPRFQPSKTSYIGPCIAPPLPTYAGSLRAATHYPQAPD